MPVLAYNAAAQLAVALLAPESRSSIRITGMSVPRSASSVANLAGGGVIDNLITLANTASLKASDLLFRVHPSGPTQSVEA